MGAGGARRVVDNLLMEGDSASLFNGLRRVRTLVDRRR